VEQEKPSSNGSTVEDVSHVSAERRFAEALAQPLEADALIPKSSLPTQPESSYKSSLYADSFLFPYNPDPLVAGNNYEIYDEMRNDDQIKAVLSFKKDLVLSSGWQIVCDNEEIKDKLTQWLKEDMAEPFDDALRDILSSYDYGFSISEPLFRLDKGFWQLSEIKTRPPHTFKFYVDDKGDVDRLAQSQINGEKDLKRERYIHHVYQASFGNPFGTADLRAMHPPWKIKKFFLRMYAIYVERFANPTVIGVYPPNFGQAEITKLVTALASIQNNTYLAIPEGAKIDFTQPTRDSSDVYERGLNLLNLMISRAALMPDLLGMSGTKTEGGSYALGQTQFEMFLGTINKDKTALARALNLRAIRPVVLANWGDVPCRLEFLPYSDEDKIELCRVWLEAVKTGKFEPNDDEIQHMRDITRFPQGKVERPKLPEPGNPNDPNGKPNGNGGGRENNKSDHTVKNNSDKARVVRFRELTAFETKMDFVEIADTLDRAEASATRPLERAAGDIVDDLIDQIRSKNLFNRFNPEGVNEIKPRFQKPLNIGFREYFKRLYRSAYTGAHMEIFPSSSPKKFSEETNELLPEEFLALIDAEAFKIVGDYTVRITNRARNTLMEGIKGGVGEIALVKQIREQAEQETEKWLATVIRTKTTEMFNRARKSYWDNDPMAKQIVEAYQFSAVMDDRTSEVCSYLDGKVFEKGDFVDRATPPLHFNCRSVLVPITKFEDYRASAAPTIDKLKELGGNLVV
jgi:SPP1 gp7 family putative phage head morphogenesis protein